MSEDVQNILYNYTLNNNYGNVKVVLKSRILVAKLENVPLKVFR